MASTTPSLESRDPTPLWTHRESMLTARTANKKFFKFMEAGMDKLNAFISWPIVAAPSTDRPWAGSQSAIHTL
jgi:hypothetical protein